MVDEVALFDDSALKCCKVITQQYSTSFTAAIESSDERLRKPLYGLYGFTRLADEVVDTFHHKDKRLLMAELKKDVFEAIDTGISLNPVLHAFQLVVNKYNIDLSLIDSFLHSMEMDLHIKTYDEANFKEYLKGSTEAVMLMFLQVLCEGDISPYERVREPVCKLGDALQKVNDLRDLKRDYEYRGRIYFSGLNLKNFNMAAKKLIEKDIERDFEDFKSGFERLPAGAKPFFKVLYSYNLKLCDRIKASPPERILRERIRISNFERFWILYITNNDVNIGLVIFTIFCSIACCLIPGFQYASKYHVLFLTFIFFAVFFISITQEYKNSNYVGKIISLYKHIWKMILLLYSFFFFLFLFFYNFSSFFFIV